MAPKRIEILEVNNYQESVTEFQPKQNSTNSEAQVVLVYTPFHLLYRAQHIRCYPLAKSPPYAHDLSQIAVQDSEKQKSTRSEITTVYMT